MDNTRLAFLALIGLAILGAAIALKFVGGVATSEESNPTQDATTNSSNSDGNSQPGAAGPGDANGNGNNYAYDDDFEWPIDAEDPDDQRLHASRTFFDALAARDVDGIVESASTPFRKAAAAMLAAKLHANQVPALAPTLESHKASELLGIEFHPVELAGFVRDWQVKFPETDIKALFGDLLRLDYETQQPMLPAPPENFEFRMSDPEERGNVAWVVMSAHVEGEVRQMLHRLYREDGTWRMLTFHPLYEVTLSMAMAARIDSPPNFDVWAQRETREFLYEMANRYAYGEDVPAPGEDAGTAALLEALGLPETTAFEATKDDALVDAWGRAVRYEAGEGEEAAPRLRAAGYDLEFGTDADIVVELHEEPVERTNPRVELDMRLPGDDKDTVRTVVIELFESEVPNGARNFMNLVADGFYDATKFHRIVKGFMIQGGDPYTRTREGRPGTGNAGYQLPDEMSGRKYDQDGLLAYANSGPNSSSSQFFITLGPQPNLNDGFNERGPRGMSRTHYTIIGRVVEGYEHVVAAGEVEVRSPQPRAERSQPVEDVHLLEARIVGEFAGPYAVRTMSAD